MSEFELRIINALEHIYRQQKETNRLLSTLVNVEQVVDINYAPEFTFPIEQFNGFDWSKINATVLTTDNLGVSSVAYGNKVYKRYSPNKYGEIIMFSYPTVKVDNKQKYNRLCSFINLKK